MDTVVASPSPIVIDTGIPVTKGLAADKTLKEAQAAFNAVIAELAAFLKQSAKKAQAGLDADTVTLECSLSITAGAKWVVEVGATGEMSLSATWNK
jgi:hypothetical protein